MIFLQSKVRYDELHAETQDGVRNCLHSLNADYSSPTGKLSALPFHSCHTMLLLSALCATFFVAGSVAGAIPSRHVLHEKRDMPVSGWLKTHRLLPAETIPLRIHLTQSNLEHGDAHLMDVSHPTSPNYAKHWSAEQVNAFFAPPEETFDKVRQWLVSSGIAAERILQTSGELTIGVTISEAERLLKAEYHNWDHVESGLKQAACDAYHLPEYLLEHVDFVTPSITLLPPKFDQEKKSAQISRRSSGPHSAPPWAGPRSHPMPPWFNQHGHGGGGHNISEDLATCDELITPACIRALYGVPLGRKGMCQNA